MAKEHVGRTKATAGATNIEFVSKTKPPHQVVKG